MNILFDYQIFELQEAGGISKYHADLNTGIQKESINSHIGIIHSDNLHLKEAGIKTKNTFSEEDIFLGKYKFRGKHFLIQAYKRMGFNLNNSHFINAEYCRKLITNKSYDILHATYYKDLYNDITISIPTVITIHDMIFESFPYFFNNISVIHKKKEWAKRANKIIAISEYTKSEILRHYNFIKEENIHVVYHGITSYNDSTPNTQHIKDNYILYVGERWGYKNFYTLLRALKILKNKRIEYKLYCVGREFTSSELSYIDFLNITDLVVNLGRVSDVKLRELYKRAQMYVSTSMSEGFGLPLLECMKYSTPMILSDIPVYREIAGNAAIYFTAIDEYALAEAINYVYDNNKLQKQLIGCGLSKYINYSHQKTVKETIDVYKSLL